MENERKLQEFFLSNFCREYPCGSQRCDGSEECLEGCKKYKEFRDKTKEIISDLMESWFR